MICCADERWNHQKKKSPVGAGWPVVMRVASSGAGTSCIVVCKSCKLNASGKIGEVDAGPKTCQANGWLAVDPAFAAAAAVLLEMERSRVELASSLSIVPTDASRGVPQAEVHQTN